MIHRKYSGDEEILYQVRFLSSSYLQILHLQVYDPKSLDKQEILFKRLSSPLYNEELKKLKEILYNRFMLLKQGQNPVISDELRDYLKSELSLHFDFGKVPVHNNTAEQEKTVTGTNHLDDVELTSFIQQETKQMRITSAMAERLARENTDPSLAEGILNALQCPGVPGVVDTILLYVSTLEKKNRANQRLWPQLLTFDQMAELREREKKQFGVDLFANSGFRGRYMDRFGDYQPDASSDAKLAACETVVRRRIGFLEQQRLGTMEELGRLLSVQELRHVFEKETLLRYLRATSVQRELKPRKDRKGRESFGISVNGMIARFLRKLFPDESPEEFMRYLEAEEVLRIYEERCILSGREVKPSVLPSYHVKQLTEEKHCAVTEDNTMFYGVGDAVKVKVELKNVETVEVRLFELNTLSFFQNNDGPIVPSIDLDGLKPLQTQTFSYALPQAVSHVETFAFPQMDHRGVFVVDFIAGMLNSRFLVNVGSLRALTRKSLMGYAVTVVDEKGECVKEKVKILQGARTFLPNDHNEIVIPFLPPSDDDHVIPLLLVEEVRPDWFFAAREMLMVEKEKYQLQVCGDVDNEAIVKGNERCEVVLRVSALLNGLAYPVSLLRNVAITLVCKAAQDVCTETTLKPTLRDNKDFTYVFRVPDKVISLKATVNADVSLVNNSLKHLSEECVLYQCRAKSNNSNPSLKAVTTLFRRSGEKGVEYVAQVYGNAGEAIANKSCNVRIQSLLCQRMFSTELQTDAAGQLVLGSLKDVVAVKINDQEFSMNPDTFDMRLQWVCGESDEVQAVIPLVHPSLEAYRVVCNSTVSEYVPLQKVLFEEAGYVVARGLPAGSYSIFVDGTDFKTYCVSVDVRKSRAMQTVNAFAVYDGVAVAKPSQPLSLECALKDRSLAIHVQGGSSEHRVHVQCKQLFDSKVLGANLSQGDCSQGLPMVPLSPVSSVIVNNRSLPEEYAYILDRKRQKRTLPGNMLPHPGPLLNPIEYAETKNTTKEAKEGETFDGPMEGSSRAFCKRAPGAYKRENLSLSGVAIQRDACEVIIHPSEVIANVELDANGFGVVDLSGVSEEGGEVMVVCVDKEKTVQRSVFIPEVSKEARERKGANTLFRLQTLKQSLDTSKHFTEKKMISLATPESPVELSDKTEMETISALSDVYLLLKTLSQNADLALFSFLTRWESLSEDEKETLYNRYNCSEMNVFVYFRDRAFFDAKILPYLSCKLEKSFLDVYLTGGDVSVFLQPNLLTRLNAFERALLCGRVSKEAGEKLAEGMGVCGKSKVMSAKEFARIFNTALKMKAMENPEAEEEVEEEEEEKEEEEKDEDEVAEDEDMGVEEEPMALESAPFEPAMAPMCAMAMSDRMAAPMAAPMRAPILVGGKSRAMGGRRMMSMAAPSYAPTSPSFGVACGGLSVNCFAAADSIDLQEKKKKAVEKHYEKMENTKEYVEGFYYKQSTIYVDPSIVPNSPFWEAFAKHNLSNASAPFLSRDFICCTHSLSEMLFCLSVLSIPMSGASFTVEEREGGFVLRAKTPVMVFHKLLLEGNAPDAKESLAVVQKYVDMSNRWVTVRGERVERYMEVNEFLAQQPYMCKVIVTNMESRPRSLSLLYQIPSGSYPLSDSFTLRTEAVKVSPYSTSTFSYCFYFPSVGDFTHYPVQVLEESTSEVVASATTSFQPLHVMTSLHTVDKTSWRDIAFYGSESDVFEYLRSHALEDVDWSKLTWRLREKPFFLSLVSLLRGLGFYRKELWKYGVFHEDGVVTRELLEKEFADRCGLAFESSLLSVDSAVEELFQIREYKPLVNSRCFRLGKRMTITNDKLETQYEKFLTMLTQRVPRADDWLVMTYYWVLMDRMEDALALFRWKVVGEDGEHPAAGLRCLVQYDYMRAYFECFKSDLSEARAICVKYASYPIIYWRGMFENVAELVKEAEGTLEEAMEEEEAMDTTNVTSNVIRSKRMHAESESSLSVSQEKRGVSVKYSNLERVQVNVYEVDAELRFSNAPFLREKGSQAMYVRPNHSEMVALPALAENQAFGVFVYALPEEYVQKNVVVEVCAGALRESCFVFNTKLTVVVSAKSGQLRVFDQETKRPVSNCYVKVYVKVEEESKFLKDGFTDIRGYFDYFAVSNDLGDRAKKVAIFVDKEGYGSCIREVVPPATRS